MDKTLNGDCRQPTLEKRTRAQALLTALTVITAPPAPEPAHPSSLGDLPRCPHCRVGTLIVIAVLRPSWSRPP